MRTVEITTRMNGEDTTVFLGPEEKAPPYEEKLWLTHESSIGKCKYIGLPMWREKRDGSIEVTPEDFESVVEEMVQKDFPYLVHHECEKSGKADFTEYIDVYSEKKYIPRKIGNLKDVEVLKRAYEARLNTLIISPPGAGKTHSVFHVCAALGIPAIRVNLKESTTAESLVGSWLPDNGGWRWSDGLLTKFVKNGGCFIVDELNAASPGINFLFHPLLDDARTLVLEDKDGEIIQAHSDFWLVATINPEGAGTEDLNAALKDRFAAKVYYEYSARVERKLLSKTAQKIAHELRSKRADAIETPVSTRMLIAFDKNVEIFGTQVARQMFSANFNSHEVSLVNEVLRILEA